MTIADVIELSVGVEEIPAKVVGQRHTAIEAYADAAVEGLASHGGDFQVAVAGPQKPMLMTSINWRNLEYIIIFVVGWRLDR